MGDGEGACKRAGVYAVADILISVGAYMTCSVGMSVANKMAVQSFGLPTMLTAVQMAFTVLFCALPWVARHIHIGTFHDLLMFVPNAFIFSIMLMTSMKAYHLNTLATMVVFRNLAPLLTLPIETMFRYPVQWNCETVFCLLSVLLGVIMYANFQIDLQLRAVAWLIFNMLAAIVERVYYRYITAQNPIDISDAGMMFLNNIAGVVFVSFTGFCVGEWSDLKGAFVALDVAGAMWVAVSCPIGVAICYAGIRLTRRVSATSFMVCSNVCKVMVIMFGIIFLSEEFNVLSALGCGIAMAGGLWYARNRNQIKQAAELGGVSPHSVKKVDLADPESTFTATRSWEQPLLGAEKGASK